jgi:response regulator RpfG family c-di-GMP phosphodiesterase
LKALAVGFEDLEYLNLKNLLQTNLSKTGLSFYSPEKDLIEILTSEGPFSYILFNLDDKKMSAFKILVQITDVIGQRPFIFIGTPGAIKAQLTHEIVNNHKTNHILEVPIVPSEFKKAIAHCSTWIKNEEFEQSIQEYSKEDMRPLRIKNFYLFEQMPYDVYIELAPNKYGRIISKNKFYSHQLLHSYSKKNVKFLYIKKTEHIKMLDKSIKSLTNIYKSKNIDKTKAVKIHQRTIFFIQEYIRCLSVTEEISQLTHMLSDSISDFVINNHTMNTVIKEMEYNYPMSFTDAALITAYLSQMIVFEMQWSADMTKERLVLASILQDISLPNDELIKIRSLNDPLLKNFQEDEINQFRFHTIKAYEIARLFYGYTEIEFILKEHHEHPNGDGFPVGINSSSLTMISCIFILATHFTSRLARIESSSPNLKEIIISMRKIYGIGNFKDPLKTLANIFS